MHTSLAASKRRLQVANSEMILRFFFPFQHDAMVAELGPINISRIYFSSHLKIDADSWRAGNPT